MTNRFTLRLTERLILRLKEIDYFTKMQEKEIEVFFYKNVAKRGLKQK